MSTSAEEKVTLTDGEKWRAMVAEFWPGGPECEEPVSGGDLVEWVGWYIPEEYAGPGICAPKPGECDDHDENGYEVDPETGDYAPGQECAHCGRDMN